MLGKKHLVSSFVHKHKFDIVVITETYLKPQHTFKLKDYNVIRHDRPTERGGGVASFINKNLKHEQMPQINTIFELIRVKINNIIFAGVYNPPDKNITVTDLHAIMSSGPRVLLISDLNYKHPHWDSNCTNPNKNGRNLNDFAEQNDYVIQYTEEPTYFPLNDYQPSTLDIAVAKNLPNIYKTSR